MPVFIAPPVPITPLDVTQRSLESGILPAGWSVWAWTTMETRTRGCRAAPFSAHFPPSRHHPIPHWP